MRQPLIVANDGNLYGTGDGYDQSSSGIVFRVRPDGTMDILRTLQPMTEGIGLRGVIQGPDDDFYGVTSYGAVFGGTAFKIRTDGSFAVLHSFNFSEGIPQSGLTLGSDGNFYGVIRSYPSATRIFRLTPTGVFDAICTFPINADVRLLQSVGGYVYGTFTSTSTNAFFRLALADGTLTVLSGPPGVLASNGSIYYASTSGQHLDLYKRTINGQVTFLNTFPTGHLLGSLTQASDGNLYGVIADGGASGHGAFFRATLAGTITILGSFNADADGSLHVGPLLEAAGGLFYGLTQPTSPDFAATVFSMSTAGTYSLVHTFRRMSSAEGAFPQAALLYAHDGNFYGAALYGGSDDNGTVFRMTQNGIIGVVHSMNYRDGARPQGLVEGPDGDLFGTAAVGGPSGGGTVFRLRPDNGALKVLGSFFYFEQGDVAYPSGGVIEASDGLLYGTLSTGYLYRVGARGGVTLLPKLNWSAARFSAPLIQGSDGSFYGTASASYSLAGGFVFRANSDGQITILHTFLGSEDGYAPTGGGLLAASDGFLYGVTSGAVSSDVVTRSTVFRIRPSGASYQVIHVFNPDVDGDHPYGALIETKDGYLYGTTTAGGVYGQGTIFRISRTGVFAVVHHFTGGTDGGMPYAGLTATPDGRLYGVTAYGGEGAGVAFVLEPNPPAINKQPTRVFTADRTAAHFRIDATVSSSQTYQWQVSFDGLSWSNVHDGASYTGAASPTLTVSTPNATLADAHYRCVITNAMGSIISLSAPLRHIVGPFADFDGDGRSDLAVYAPSTATLRARESGRAYASSRAVSLQWGGSGDVPMIGDFDGDGTTDLAVFHPLTADWFVRMSSMSYSAGSTQQYQWGLPGDAPLVADFDGDGRTDLTVYRPATGQWLIRYSSTGYAVEGYGLHQWGVKGDVPLVADFDGDGKTDLTVYRPATGQWFIRYSSTGYHVDGYGLYQWGVKGDVPLAADFDGDGRTDLAVYRPATGQWFIRYSSTDYAIDGYGLYQWGATGDVPLVGDFDGDGKTELTVYRPSTGEWFIRRSSTAYAVGEYEQYQWGEAGDIAQPSR